MKSVVGLILGVIGAIGSICLSIMLLGLYVAVKFGESVLLENTMLAGFASKATFWLIIMFVWFLIIGIVFSSMMNRRGKVRKGGVGCLVSGILGLNPFLVIGGVMAIYVGGISPPQVVGMYQQPPVVQQQPNVQQSYPPQQASQPQQQSLSPQSDLAQQSTQLPQVFQGQSQVQPSSQVQQLGQAEPLQPQGQQSSSPLSSELPQSLEQQSQSQQASQLSQGQQPLQTPQPPETLQGMTESEVPTTVPDDVKIV